jgi:hypothetical protein
LAEHAPRKLPRGHRPTKQKPLDQVEAHFSDGKKVGSRLNALSERPCAITIGKANDLAAHCLLRAIIRAARNEFAINIDLDKREVVKPDERWPFRSQIVYRNADLVTPGLLGNNSRQRQVPDDLGTIYLNDEPIESLVIW